MIMLVLLLLCSVIFKCSRLKTAMKSRGQMSFGLDILKHFLTKTKRLMVITYSNLLTTRTGITLR